MNRLFRAISHILRAIGFYLESNFPIQSNSGFLSLLRVASLPFFVRLVPGSGVLCFLLIEPPSTWSGAELLATHSNTKKYRFSTPDEV